MTNSIEQIHMVRYWLKIITTAVLGGGFLAFLLTLVYVLGSLAESIGDAPIR